MYSQPAERGPGCGRRDSLSSLDRVLGNEKIKEYIRRAVSLDRVSHSYIVEGEKGSGKKMLTRSFARILQCEGEGPSDCGRCSSCIQIDHGNHPDVIEVVHEKPTIISVDEVREQIVNTVDIIPYRAPYKIYIIDDADLLRVEAQNALLKTIEEPPEYAILFLLVSNRNTLLDTILSRCVLLQTAPVSREAVMTFLSDSKSPEIRRLSKEELAFAAGYAMGNIGKAIEAAESEEFRECSRLVTEILGKMQRLSIEEMTDYAKKLSADKNKRFTILDLFLIRYRDMLILKTGGSNDRIVFKEEENRLQEQCDRVSVAAITEVIREIAKIRDRLRANVNAEAMMLMLLLKANRIDL